MSKATKTNLKVTFSNRGTHDLGQSQNRYEGQVQNVIYRVEANSGENDSFLTAAELVVERVSDYGSTKMKPKLAYVSLYMRDEEGCFDNWKYISPVKVSTVADAKRYAREMVRAHLAA